MNSFLPDFIWKFKIPFTSWFLYIANNDTDPRRYCKYFSVWYDGPHYVLALGPFIFNISQLD